MFDAKKAREGLQDILNDKEYTIYYADSKSIFAIWWEKAKEWLANQLAKLFPSFEPTSGAAGPLLIVIIAVVIALLGLSMFFLVRNQRRNRRMQDNKPLQSIKEMNWSFQKHLAEARKQEALEEYSRSTRHLFLALLLYFHEREWLEARIWKTNWDYYDELRKVNQQWADLFFNLAHFFDEVTYGERKVGKDEYIQFRTEAMKWLEETDELLEK